MPGREAEDMRERFGAIATLYEVTEAPQEAITLTAKAAGKIGELLGGQEDSEDQALRVAVRGGGCSGFQYALAFDRAKDDDHVFEVDGVAVVVDKVSMQFVFGSEVDYIEGLQGAGFQVNNPNVVAACCTDSTNTSLTNATSTVTEARVTRATPIERGDLPVSPNFALANSSG